MNKKKAIRRKAIKLQNTDSGSGRKIRPLAQAIQTIKEQSNGTSNN